MYENILSYLPNKSSFRFVDNISHVDAEGATGDYTLKQSAFFYEDHFAGNPVTPGAIITEIMAQIGLVVMGIYLVLGGAGHIALNNANTLFPLLTYTEVSFFKMVVPPQTVTVKSKKIYFRFGKLKCAVEMFDEKNELVASGTFAGIIKTTNIKTVLA